MKKIVKEDKTAMKKTSGKYHDEIIVEPARRLVAELKKREIRNVGDAIIVRMEIREVRVLKDGVSYLIVPEGGNCNDYLVDFLTVREADIEYCDVDDLKGRVRGTFNASAPAAKKIFRK